MAMELEMPEPTAIPKTGNETAIFKLMEASKSAADAIPHHVKWNDCEESIMATQEATKKPTHVSFKYILYILYIFKESQVFEELLIKHAHISHVLNFFLFAYDIIKQLAIIQGDNFNFRSSSSWRNVGMFRIQTKHELHVYDCRM